MGQKMYAEAKRGTFSKLSDRYPFVTPHTGGEIGMSFPVMGEKVIFDCHSHEISGEG
ncbi:MAG: hypothetical protein ABID54_03430 [Pseudomonadota bacterium]